MISEPMCEWLVVIGIVLLEIAAVCLIADMSLRIEDDWLARKSR